MNWVSWRAPGARLPLQGYSEQATSSASAPAIHSGTNCCCSALTGSEFSESPTAGPLDALPNGFASLTPDGDLRSLPGVTDATILISNVCSIGGHAAEELFHGSRDKERLLDPPGIALDSEGQQLEFSAEGSQGEKSAQHSPLREEHITCVHSKAQGCESWGREVGGPHCINTEEEIKEGHPEVVGLLGQG